MLRALRGLLRLAYCVYALTAFTVLFLFATLAVLLAPGLERRRALTRGFARLALRVLGIRVAERGLQHLPAEASVVVANHSSYLDGIVMKAVLPPRFSFVIKREASSIPVVGYLLRRIGSEFVDRHNHGSRHRDARRVMRRAEQGHSLVFFPEGTFMTEPGLRRFHIGAFVAAMRAGMPVVPTVIRGARRLMPNESYLPRPGRIEVEVTPAILVDEAGGGLEALRDAARQRIAAGVDEPDLHPAREH